MGRSASGLALWLLLLAFVGAVMAQADRVNKSSSGGLFWSTAKEEGDLMRKSEAQESTVGVNDNADLDGGFSSLDGMLQWAIGYVKAYDMGLTHMPRGLKTILTWVDFQQWARHDLGLI